MFYVHLQSVICVPRLGHCFGCAACWAFNAMCDARWSATLCFHLPSREGIASWRASVCRMGPLWLCFSLIGEGASEGSLPAQLSERGLLDFLKAVYWTFWGQLAQVQRNYCNSTGLSKKRNHVKVRSHLDFSEGLIPLVGIPSCVLVERLFEGNEWWASAVFGMERCNAIADGRLGSLSKKEYGAVPSTWERERLLQKWCICISMLAKEDKMCLPEVAVENSRLLPDAKKIFLNLPAWECEKAARRKM